MKRLVRSGAISIATTIAGSSLASMPDLPVLTGAQVSAFVDELSPGVLQYHFRVTNGGTSLQIRDVTLDIGTDPSRETLSWDGIAFSKPSERTSSEFNLAHMGPASAVPCASTSSPTGWTAGILAEPALSWMVIHGNYKLAPGNSQTFQAVCRGLPGIRTLRVTPDLFDMLPNFEETDVEIDEYTAAVDNSDQLVRTVGPVAPPAEFTPRGFLQEVLTLRDDAVTAGWIRTPSATATLTSLLSRLDQELASNSFAAARNTAEQAAQEVERISCNNFACDPSQPLTAEARALLAMNLRYLAARLPVVTQPLMATGWLGLKNSDDQGTSFDVRAELYLNGALVAAGETLCVPDLTRDASQAKEVPIPIDAGNGVSVPSGAVLSLKLSTRIGTNPDGTKCPGHSNAVGIRLYYDAVSRASGFRGDLTPGSAPAFFLHATGSTLLFNETAPTGATALTRDSASVKFSGGNVWKEIGTWSRTAP